MRHRLLAASHLFLLCPAVLFLTAVVLHHLPLQLAPAQQLVLWYAERMWTLWLLLLALPFTVLVTGSAVLLHTWHRDLSLRDAWRQSLLTLRANLPDRIIAITTPVAAVILVIVALHMAAN